MYKVKLNTFEGPLDLLLFFIRRDELDIYNIPISTITKEFTSYLHMLEQLDLEVAGDFLLMAATLMQIKVRMLLPKKKDEKGDEIDPRNELVNALIEYKRYKEMSEEFTYLEGNQRKVFYRGNFEKDEVEHKPELDVLLKNISLYDLIKAFQNAMMEKPKEVVHEIERLNISIDDQMEFILSQADDNGRLPFTKLVNGMTEKIRVIVTFIALLELIKAGKLELFETPDFNNFEIQLIYG